MANDGLTLAQLQEQLKFKNWDPNEGVSKGDLICKIQSLPEFFVGAASVDEYANYFTSFTKSHGGLSALSKTIYQAHEIPPSVQSFTKISYMPNAQTQQFGVLQWPGLPPEVLEKLAREHPAAQMIISTRVDEVLKYSQLATKPWEPGWQIVCKDPDEIPSSSVRKEMREAEEFLMNGGHGGDFADPRIRDALLRVDFTKFLGEITRNSLTFDGVAIWTEWAKDNHLLSFAPLPAQQIRLLARPDKANYNPAHFQGELDFYGISDKDDVIHRRAAKHGNQFSGDDFAVAVDESGNIVDKFNRKQLIWYTRNPRLDVAVGNYGYPELEMSLTLVTGFTNAINFNCYSEDTEILTNHGWKLFNNINKEEDLISTLNEQTQKFEWQYATDIIWQEYEGDMYRAYCRSLDILVTPNHRLLLQSKPSANIGGQTKEYIKKGNIGRLPIQEIYRTITAESFYKELNNRYSEYWNIPVTAKWEGVEVKSKEFIDGWGRSIKMTGDEYCAFMGAYLAEGYIGSTVNNEQVCPTVIYQNEESKGYEPYKLLLKSILKKEPYHSFKRFSFQNKGLAFHLKQYGKDCYSKYIPEEIMNATPRQIKIFWDYYELGDGSTQKSNGGTYLTKRRGKGNGERHSIWTSSEQIANQLQELAIKMGNSAHIYFANESTGMVPVTDNKYNVIGYQTCDVAPRYQISLKYANAHPFQMEKIQYRGFIGCVTVPNGTICIRRKGNTCFSKNSDIFDKNAIPKAILALKGNFTQRQLDAMGRVWDNLQRGPRTDWSLPAIQVSEKGSIELISLEPLRKESVYYQYLVNLFMGAVCAIYRFPSHRLGYKLSGTERDSRPDLNKQLLDEDDIGLPVLLTHIEVLINTYLLGRWPGLKFKFTGKSPKEDARLYEAWLLSMTLDEKRQTTGLPRLIDTVETPAEKEAAQILGLCPVDPSLIGVYQAWIAAKAKGFSMSGDEATGIMGGGPGANEGLKEQPGSRFRSKKDPAKSLGHGHQSGTRRNSKQERTSAERSKPPNLRRFDATDYTRVDRSTVTRKR